MYRIRKNGSTSNIERCRLLQDGTGANPGYGKTGISGSSTGLLISTIADNESAPTVYSHAGGTIQTIATVGTYAAPSASNCRFEEIDPANNPGDYELQFADARYAVSGAKSLRVTISGVSGMLPKTFVVQLTTVDPDSAAFGLTLAKTTNITGFNDIAATAVVSGGAITTSGGKVSEVALVDTLTTYTGNTPQTGDSFARIGAAGAGLTALGDARIAHLDADVSSRASATAAPSWYTAPDNTDVVSILTSVGAGLGTALAAVKAQTDKLGFTVAGKVDANVLYVNGVQVHGAGTSLSPWGP